MKISLLAVLFSILAAPAFAKVIHVQVSGLAFSPAKVSAQVGDTIEWRNSDFIDHTVTTDNKEWDILLPAHGGIGRIALKKPGHIQYYCRYHPAMTGEVTIEK